MEFIMTLSMTGKKTKRNSAGRGKNKPDNKPGSRTLGEVVLPDEKNTKLLDALLWIFLSIVLLFFLVMKSFSFHWQIGDENVYFYMAWATLDHGALPYRDYFFAHPPLHLLPGLAVFSVFGFSPLTVRIIPVFATVLSAFFLMRIARKNIGRIAAGATVVVILTSFSLLRASTHWTGINLSMMWISVGLYFLFKKKHAAAGAMFALGVCTGNYVLPGAVMAAMLAALESPGSLLKFFVGFIVPWAAIQATGLAVGGESYLDGVYKYHFLKPTKPGVSRQMFYRVATDNFMIHLGTILALSLTWLDSWFSRHLGLRQPEGPEGTAHVGLFANVWTWFRRVLLLDPAKGLARIGALWALGYLIFIAIIPRVFPFYFLLAFPGLALATGYTAWRLLTIGYLLLHYPDKRTTSWRRAMTAFVGIFIFAIAAFAIRVPIQRKLLPHYTRSRPVPMVWSDSPLPVNGLIRWCCWDDIAQPTTSYGTVQEILYHESRYFSQPQVLADWLRQHSNPDQNLFGDSSTAGLVAMLSGRRLVDDFADTNTMRFISGVTPASEVIDKIDKKSLGFVLVKQRRFRNRNGIIRTSFEKFASLPEFRQWLDIKFHSVFRTKDRTKGTFVILARKGEKQIHSSK